MISEELEAHIEKFKEGLEQAMQALKVTKREKSTLEQQLEEKRKSIASKDGETKQIHSYYKQSSKIVARQKQFIKKP